MDGSKLPVSLTHCALLSWDGFRFHERDENNRATIHFNKNLTSTFFSIPNFDPEWNEWNCKVSLPFYPILISLSHFADINVNEVTFNLPHFSFHVSFLFSNFPDSNSRYGGEKAANQSQWNGNNSFEMLFNCKIIFSINIHLKLHG